MADEILQRDQNHIVVLGGITDDVAQEIRMFRVDPITKRLLISATGLGSGTVTSIAAGVGIAATPDPITTTGTISLSTALQPMATLTGKSLLFLRVNVGETAVEYAATGTVTSVSGTADRITSTGGATPVIDIAATYVGQTSITTLGTIGTGTWAATTIALNHGGTGLTSISALSIWVANSANVLAEVVVGAGQSVRVNGGATAWEVFTPSAGVPSTITVANEATDTTCFIAFFTAATGDLGPKTNTNLIFNSNTSALSLTGAFTATTINGLAITANGTNTLNIAAGKTLTVSNSGTLAGGDAFILAIAAGKTLTVSKTLTFDGTDSTTMTFPTTSATIARTDAANTFTGASTASAWVLTSPTITTKLNPTTDDGAPLGDTTHNWSDLFLASGAVINYANGNVVITHTSGILTMGTGDLRVTNAGSDATSVVTVGGSQTLTSKTLTSPTLTTPSAFTTGGTITLAENTTIALDPAGSADGKFTGISVTAVAGYAQAFGDLVYLDPTDSRWEKCDANAAQAADGDSRGIIGIVVVAGGSDGAACTILLQGIIRADAAFPAFTINNPCYVSETAGAITQTQPTTTDVVIRVVGFAITADEMYFNPSPDYITHT